MKKWLSFFTSIFSFSPTNDKAYFNRGFSKEKRKDYYGAIADYNEAIKLNDSVGEHYFNRGMLKYDLGKTKEACLDFKKAKELNYDSKKAEQLGYEDVSKYSNLNCPWTR